MELEYIRGLKPLAFGIVGSNPTAGIMNMTEQAGVLLEAIKKIQEQGYIVTGEIHWLKPKVAGLVVDAKVYVPPDGPHRIELSVDKDSSKVIRQSAIVRQPIMKLPDLGTSEVCPMCGNVMYRTGSCFTCGACGHTGSCG